jgi:hypothetical protein
MRTKLYLLVIVALVASSLASVRVGQASPSAQNLAAPIRLKVATFVPTLGEKPSIPERLTLTGYAAGQRGYYLIQFQGPVEQAWKNQVAALGAELLEYVPDFAFKVRMTPEQAAQVGGLSQVAWVGLFHPAYKINPNLIRNGVGLYNVRIERGANADLATAAIAAVGAQVLSRAANRLWVAADRAQVDATAKVLDVAWIDNYTVPEKHNEYGGGAVLGSSIANANGYDGSTQIVAVADTGLGGGTAATAHPDIPASRIVAIYNWPGVTDSCFRTIVNDGAVDVDSGHGTHTSGSVLSDGGASGEGRGTAPAARLVFQATENWVITSPICKALGNPDGYYLAGLPSDLHSLYQQAYNAGARIHSNSWGSAVSGDYNANSVESDDFMWDNRDMVITFSAGNNGIDANSDGVIDNDSIGSPGTAKNVITVGASENDRAGNYQCDSALTYTNTDGDSCNSLGGQNPIFTYGTAWPTDYPADPIRSDLSAGKADQMAAFSSRGPTDDGRIKPDVVAPGTWVLSNYSDLYQQGYDPSTNPRNNAWQYDGWGFPLNQFYKYMGGTSMSNPLTAGAAAVVRDFYQKARSVSASAALVKATLINSAVDLLDENNDGADDNDFPIPNNHEGWGRVNLVNATDGSAQFVDNSAGLSTGGSANYQYSIVAGDSPFKATLVWTDFPSTETAAKNLVNDLNLIVTAPGGATYRGNVFSGGWSQTGGSADNTNNVENIYVQSAAAGVWTVQISGANVPNGPQPFALVVDGSFGSLPAPAAPSNLTATAVSTSQINLAWTDNANNEDGFKIERCTGAGCSNFAQIATVGVNATTYSDTGLAANTSYSYRVRAYNAGGDSAYSNTASATTQAITPPSAPSNLTATAVSSSQIDLSWTDNANNEDGFKIERCTGAGCSNFAQITTVGANVTTYSDTGLTASTSYSYRVRANNTGGDSAYSNTASATTQAAATPPAAPSSLTATAVSSSQINLAWTDNANNEDGFKIERCTGAGCSNFAQIATVGANVTTYSNTGLTANTSYSYRVRANNAGGDSAYSNTASATTQAAATPPAAPSGLTATAVSSNQINLAWTDNANNEDGFKIERCTGNGCTNFVQIAQIGPNTTTYSNTGLSARTIYRYRVRAYNAAGNSAYSNSAKAKTLR